MKRALVIYHANCPDGFTAAWACHKHLGGNVELFEGYYGHMPPDVTGRDVLLVDFAYSRETLLEMKDKARSLHLLDHHKTAEEDLRGLDFCHFDMNRSGAGLAWDLVPGIYDHADAPPRPWIIDYVEDRDLWRFTLPDSQVVNDAIMAEPYTLEAWEAMSKRELASVVGAGRAVRRKIDSYCRSMLVNVRMLDVHIELPGRTPGAVDRVPMRVPVVNAQQVFISDLLHFVLKETRSRLAIGWWQRGDGLYQYSLRSEDALDASAIARKYGGGGHKNAAGFQVKERIW